MRRFVIDTDTASDDAVALIMAAEWPDVHIEAVTTVAGNVSLPQATRNALYTLQVCGCDCPVFAGAAAPLQREAAIADWFHGADGMGNMNYPAPVRDAENKDAVSALTELFSANPGDLTLVTLGPLTNIAKALQRTPTLAREVKHCYVMGGAACTNGNVTPAAEYNIWCDPEAAQVVFHSGMPITMIGWELSCGAATLDDAEIAGIRALGTERATLAMDCNNYALKAVREIQGESGLALADPVAMAVALDADACSHYSPHYVDISCDAELTRGMTVVDKLNVTKQPANVEVCWQLDHQHWKRMLRSALS